MKLWNSGRMIISVNMHIKNPILTIKWVCLTSLHLEQKNIPSQLEQIACNIDYWCAFKEQDILYFYISSYINPHAASVESNLHFYALQKENIIIEKTFTFGIIIVTCCSSSGLGHNFRQQLNAWDESEPNVFFLLSKALKVKENPANRDSVVLVLTPIGDMSTYMRRNVADEV